MSCPKGSKHNAVHFDFKRPDSAWICIACGELISFTGMRPSLKTIIELCKFAKIAAEHIAPGKQQPAGALSRKTDSMKPADHVAAHVNGLKSSIHSLEVQLTILKQIIGTKVKAAKETEADDAGDDSDEEEKPAKKTGKGKPAKKGKPAFGDEDEDAEESDADDSDDDSDDGDSDDADESDSDDSGDEDEKPAKKGKAAKVTVDDLNEACIARVKRTKDRTGVLSLMRKHFKVKSVTDIEPKDYARFIKVMNS